MLSGIKKKKKSWQDLGVAVIVNGGAGVWTERMTLGFEVLFALD